MGFSFGGEAARVLKLGYGRNILFETLRGRGILMQSKHNIPYQCYIDSEYFKCIEQSYINPHDGKEHISIKAVVTPKGQEWLLKILK